MTQTLTINTARSNPATALVASTTQLYTPKTFPQISAGETIDVEMFLPNDARSGAAGYTPSVSITLADHTPQSGTFTISDDTETTALLDWDSTAFEIETALNELNTDTGPNGDTVTVQKFANGSFNIKFDTEGAQNALTIKTENIYPSSSGSVVSIVTGDSLTRAVQLVQIKADELMSETTVAQITDGWSMKLDADVANLKAATAAGAISANYTIKITATDTTSEVVASGPVILHPAT
jgi:hypothetical protein